MVSNLVFYQLVLIALVWVFLMLSWVWPSEPAAARLIPPTPVTPPRKRSTAPTPFPGLTRKPHCDACAHTIEDRRLPLPSAPPRRSSQPVDVGATSTPHAIAVPMRTVAMAAGSGSAISVPMDFLPFVNPNLSHFLPHLHDRLTTNPAGIIARTMTQHGHQDTQESAAHIA